MSSLPQPMSRNRARGARIVALNRQATPDQTAQAIQTYVDREAPDRCGNVSPLYPDGTWPCDLLRGHDGCHESREGNWMWRDAPDERSWWHPRRLVERFSNDWTLRAVLVFCLGVFFLCVLLVGIFG